jgi:hypothetical protein
MSRQVSLLREKYVRETEVITISEVYVTKVAPDPMMQCSEQAGAGSSSYGGPNLHNVRISLTIYPRFVFFS